MFENVISLRGRKIGKEEGDIVDVSLIVNVVLFAVVLACLAEIAELRQSQRRWKERYFKAKQPAQEQDWSKLQWKSYR